ncbi:hypothetical protein CV102_17670 [Natronococcus pandeyae]|uniref:Uncharacterized protein n=2 Tax=Natronococcus pandeyae TaxID=2055836 RepID=A0A8J8TR01_9EURY|nr:hypothetical protein CV102_17670 [Natronococcus pandeyae]
MGSKRISDFLDSLGEEVLIHEIRSIQLVNPRDSQSAISEMSIQGSTASDNLLSEPEVGERIDDGWLVKGVEFTVEYENEIFSVTVSGSDVMAYSKIENVADRMKGMMLMDVIRGYFLDNLRFQDTGRMD